MRTYALWHGQAREFKAFGVSHHTLGCLMERGQLGRSLPGAVIKALDDEPDAIAAAVMGTGRH